jgi:phage terminase large subunit GpA-like protein
VHFPADTGDGSFDQDFYKQLTSERAVTRYKEGRPYRVWVLPPKMRNEALDCSVYALAARVSLPIRLNAPLKQPEAPPPTPRPVAALERDDVPLPSPSPPPPPARQPQVQQQPQRYRRRVFRSMYMS